MTTSTDTSAVTDSLRKLLGRNIKCTLDDGRTATGTFICIDRLANVILANVVEERWVSTSDYSLSTQEKLKVFRRLSQAMVPGERLLKVEVDKEIYDAIEIQC